MQKSIRADGYFSDGKSHLCTEYNGIYPQANGLIVILSAAEYDLHHNFLTFWLKFAEADEIRCKC